MRRTLTVLAAFVAIAFLTGGNCNHHDTVVGPEATPTEAPTSGPTSGPTAPPPTLTSAPPTATIPPPTLTPAITVTPTLGAPVIDDTGVITIDINQPFEVQGSNLGGCQSSWDLLRPTDHASFPLTCQFGDNRSVQLLIPLTSTITPNDYNVRVTRTDHETAISIYLIHVF